MQKAMEGAWGNLTVEMQEKLRLEELAMQEVWQRERIRLQEENRLRQLAQHQAWEAAVAAQKQAEIDKQANEWAQSFTEQHAEEIMQSAFEKGENEVLSKDAENEAMKGMASDMIDVMLHDPDPKFKNSQFLQFLGKLQSGEYKIENNELVVDPTKAVPLDTTTKRADEKQKDPLAPDLVELAELEAEETKQEQGVENLMERAWKLAQEGNEDEANRLLEQLNEAYMKELHEMEMANAAGDGDKVKDHMSEAWQKAQDVEEQALYRDVVGPYAFSSANPYANGANPLEEAMKLIQAGKTCAAILALEAHLQREPGDAENWRVLGRLHQENDEDPRAVSCLLEAVKLDPTHLDTHLSLGVSCTNTLDETRAMNYLNKWLLFNPKYQALKVNPQIIPPHKLETNSGFTTEEIKRYNQELIDWFNKAQGVDPKDPGLHSALAVLYFIARNYEMSVTAFKTALQFDHLNYSLWNKLGATLAHLGRTDEAIEAYHQALELKPNYVRVWVNLGIAQAYKKDYEEAARFYLNALSFNPNAVHLWTYLNSAFVMLDRVDLVAKIKTHDVRAFAKDFEILNVEELPPPQVDYGLAHMQFVVQKEAEQWGAEMMKMANPD
jgi:peroxin-5